MDNNNKDGFRLLFQHRLKKARQRAKRTEKEMDLLLDLKEGTYKAIETSENGVLSAQKLKLFTIITNSNMNHLIYTGILNKEEKKLLKSQT